MIRLIFLFFAQFLAREIFTGFTKTGSAVVGSKCEFPFTFGNRTHDDCHFSTRSGLDAPASWCITNSTTREWGVCLPAEVFFEIRIYKNSFFLSIRALKTNSEKVKFAELGFKKLLPFLTLETNVLHLTASFTILLSHSPHLRICSKLTFKIQLQLI